MIKSLGTVTGRMISDKSNIQEIKRTRKWKGDKQTKVSQRQRDVFCWDNEDILI